MVLLLPLLLAVEWLITACPLPQGTITGGTVVAKPLNVLHSSEIPTIATQVSRRDVLGIPASQMSLYNHDTLTDDTARKGMDITHRTLLELTNTGLSGLGQVEKRTNGRKILEDPDNNTCVFAKKKIILADKKVTWDFLNDDVAAKSDCNKYCETHSTKRKMRSSLLAASRMTASLTSPGMESNLQVCTDVRHAGFNVCNS